MTKKIILLLSDIFAFLIAFLIAFCVKAVFGNYEKNFIETVKLLYWLPLIVVFTFGYENLYSKNRPFWMEVRLIFRALFLAFLAIFALASIGKVNDSLSRFIILSIWLQLIYLVPIFRIFSKKLFNISEKVVIIGSDKTAITCAKALIKDKYLGYEILCFLTDEQLDKKYIEIFDRKIRVIQKTKNISKISSLGIKTAIVSSFYAKVEFRSNFKLFHSYMKNIIFAPDAKGLPLANTEPFFLFEQDIFLLKINNNLESKTSQTAKRFFDLLLALCLLPILLLTIGIIALLIKKDSSGAVFYKHKRIGQNGKSFSIYKFRSMYKDSKERLDAILTNDIEAKKEWDSSFKLKNDPRITKIGAILRKTSLDELPQIFNVLRGDMSFVGPRPVLQQEIDEHYKDSAVYYKMVPPGITGLWQVAGRSDTTYEERVKLDVAYVTNWSLWLDIVILIKTFKTALKQEGAY